jgi:hypothetical protein
LQGERQEERNRSSRRIRLPATAGGRRDSEKARVAGEGFRPATGGARSSEHFAGPPYGPDPNTEDVMKRFLLWSMLTAMLLLVWPDSREAEAAGNGERREPDTVVVVDSVRAVARLLVANGASQDKALPVAAAVMKYSRRRDLDPLLVVAIIGVENAELQDRAHSERGATGVMQVMPSWKRSIRDCGQNLHNVDVNVCFGTRILRLALDDTRSIQQALLRYNGCSRAERCGHYAGAVFNRAGKAMLLARAE